MFEEQWPAVTPNALMLPVTGQPIRVYKKCSFHTKLFIFYSKVVCTPHAETFINLKAWYKHARFMVFWFEEA
jgi:hypothetical protein